MSSDQQESEVVERRRGQHLTLLDRGVIEAGFGPAGLFGPLLGN